MDSPEIVALDTATDAFGPAGLRNLRLFGVRECLPVRTGAEHGESWFDTDEEV